MAQPRGQAKAADISSAAVTLPGAVEAAWQRALQASESAGLMTRARADQAAAAAWWAAPPSLQFNHRTGRWQGDNDERETELGVSVPVWLPGQRQARGQAAQAELEAAEVGSAAAKLNVAGQVRETAWTIALHRAEGESIRLRQRSLHSLAADVDRRVSAGELARADALAARAEVLAVESLRAEASARLQAAEAQWTVLTGLERVPDPREQGALPAAAAAVDAHPELLSYLHRVELARKRLELAGKSRRAPPEVMAWYRNETAGGTSPSSNSVGIGIRLPLGTDDRNLPLLAAASSEYDVAQAAAKAVRERLVAELAAARASLAAAEEQVVIERSRSSMLGERTRLLATAFRSGETSLPETLRTYAASMQAEANLARQEAATGKARAKYRQALGLMP